MESTPQLLIQMRVSRLLGVGFACTMVSPGGINCIIALVIGLKARGIIKNSDYDIHGLKMAWWCIVVGMIGMMTMLPYTALLILKALKL